MNVDKKAAELIEKIMKEGYVKVNEQLTKGDESADEFRLKVAHKICDDKRFMHDPNNTYYIYKNPNYELSEDIRKTNESVRTVNKLFWATVIVSAFSLIASLADVYVQIQSLQLQIKKELKDTKLPTRKTNQSLKVLIPYNKDTTQKTLHRK